MQKLRHSVQTCHTGVYLVVAGQEDLALAACVADPAFLHSTHRQHPDALTSSMQVPASLVDHAHCTYCKWEACSSWACSRLALNWIRMIANSRLREPCFQPDVMQADCRPKSWDAHAAASRWPLCTSLVMYRQLNDCSS